MTHFSLFSDKLFNYSNVMIMLLLFGHASIVGASEADVPHVHPAHHHVSMEPSLEGHHNHGAGAHAPAGITGDHAHGSGEIMISYMYMDMRMNGLRTGSDRIEYVEVPTNYTMVPTEMGMRMHMLHVMYAPTDELTLVLISTYEEKEMTMEVIRMGMGMSGHGGHSMAVGSQSTHQLEGWGDTQLGALYQFWKSGTHEVLGSFLFSAPTGSVSIKNGDGTYTHYGMQMGSGTWDAIPGVVYTGSQGSISWGAKMAVTVRLEDENRSGYQLGNVADISAWAAWSPVSVVSLSTRLAYRDEGQLSGHYNGIHNHSSPPDVQANYGGKVLSAGFGVNGIIPIGGLGDHRIGAEVIFPLKQDLNGIQLGQDLALSLSWTTVF